MGTNKYKPFPDEIFNIYAECDPNVYGVFTADPHFKLEENKIYEKTPANCTITIVSTNNVFQYDGSIHLIGYGSRLHKKLSWSMKFGKKFYGRNTIKLRAMANDPSLIREKFASDLYKSAGVPVQECTYARLLINNDNYGLYTMIDSLNGKWIKNYVHGDNKAQIGFAYKLDSAHPDGNFADLRYISDDYKDYTSLYTYRVDEYEGDKTNPLDPATQFQRLVQFTKLYHDWVATYGKDNSDKAVTELEKFLNVESLLRLLAVDTLTMATDNFFVVNSNSDLYYNPQKNNYQVLPFDFDNSLCGPSDNILISPEGYMDDCITWVNYDEAKYEHYFTNNILSHPQLKDRYDVILSKISNYPFNKDVISQYVRAVADLIREDVKWNFELMDNLSIKHDGIQKHFTEADFENNLINRNLDLATFKKDGVIQVDFMQYVEMRGDKCRAYTANVDVSKNKKSEYDLDLTDDDLILSGASSIYHLSTFVLLLLSLFIVYYHY